MLDVAVVVVAYNSRDLLPDLVASLPRGLGELRWRLVVADNDSQDGTIAWLHEHAPDALVVATGRNGGYAAGLNAGVAAAREAHGEPLAYLLMNPDVRLQPGCGPALLRAAGDQGIGIVVPHLVDAHGRLIESQRREPTVLRAVGDAVLGCRLAGKLNALGEVVTDPRAYTVEATTDWAEGSTQLVTAECWAACGPWDETFFLYSEETDFALRARDAGFRTRYLPTAHAVHLEGGSGASPQLWALLMVNRVKLFRRRNGLGATVGFWAATLLREGSRAALGRATSRAAVAALLSPRRLRERVAGPHSLERRGRGRYIDSGVAGPSTS